MITIIVLTLDAAGRYTNKLSWVNVRKWLIIIVLTVIIVTVILIVSRAIKKIKISCGSVLI